MATFAAWTLIPLCWMNVNVNYIPCETNKSRWTTLEGGGHGDVTVIITCLCESHKSQIQAIKVLLSTKLPWVS